MESRLKPFRSLRGFASSYQNEAIELPSDKLSTITCYEIEGLVFKNGLGIDQDDLIKVKETFCIHPDDINIFANRFIDKSTSHLKSDNYTIAKSDIENTKNWRSITYF